MASGREATERTLLRTSETVDDPTPDSELDEVPAQLDAREPIFHEACGRHLVPGRRADRDSHPPAC